jgi:hypothetical protein
MEVGIAKLEDPGIPVATRNGTCVNRTGWYSGYVRRLSCNSPRSPKLEATKCLWSSAGTGISVMNNSGNLTTFECTFVCIWELGLG